MNIKSHENSNVNDISHEEWLIVYEGYPNIQKRQGCLISHVKSVLINPILEVNYWMWPKIYLGEFSLKFWLDNY